MVKPKDSKEGSAKRLKWVRGYFDVLQSSEIIKSTPLFIDFISVGEKTVFEKLKEKHSKVRKPESIAETMNFNGKARVGVTSEKVSIGDCLEPFSKMAQELYNRVMRANQTTVGLMEKLAEAFREEASAYKELASLYLSISVPCASA